MAAKISGNLSNWKYAFDDGNGAELICTVKTELIASGALPREAVEKIRKTLTDALIALDNRDLSQVTVG